MSNLRPECGDAGKDSLPAPTGLTAYLQIYAAVDGNTRGLCHGTLHRNGLSCAVGAYFDVDSRRTLRTTMLDEVAAINDAVPSYTPIARRNWVLRWLRWKLGTYGYHIGRGRRPKHEPKVA